ncbi:hypothetical protein ACF08M_38625 [Streptomyces sp. NPDC015032]|uniref:hypothetical protein n=1 Tax=Streptomyces sp. NPDC015032 TaxID=3364937 RepID=UPI0036FB6488
MSYGYGSGPNWPMIQAKRRAEQEADSARAEIAGHRASAARWEAAFEALAVQVRAAVGRTGTEHREDDRCGCTSCWDALIEKLAKEAGGGRRPPNTGGTGTFSLSDLFGGAGPQQHS